jgi:hypothetical protein
MNASILIKHSTSKCNKELLQFLHQNIALIKKKYILKIIIVYDDMIPKLGKNIKQLPLLIVGGNSIVGNAAIHQHLAPSVGESTVIGKTPKDVSNCDLDDYWNKEMHSGVDNDMDENDDLMDAVKRRAMDQTQHHQETNKPKKKKCEPIVSSTRRDNIQLQNVGDKISDIVSDDPVMKKFWENQECTPGFE